MKHRLLSLLAACCMAMAGFSAVTYSLNESFESGIPERWSQAVINTTYPTSAWILDSLATNPTGAADSTSRVALRSNGENYCVRLITPELDLTNVNTPLLSFAFAQAKRSGARDTLTVYYRTSSDAAWQSLRKYQDDQNAWKRDTIELPNAAKTATCQFAFEGKLNGGYGVVLDAVRVFPASQCKDAQFTDFIVGSTSAMLGWDERTGRRFELIVSASKITNMDEFDPASAVFYDDAINDAFVQVDNLNPTTTYYVYLRTDCEDNESGHTNWVNTTFTTAIGVPYAPVLSAFPSTWSRYSGPTTVSVNASELTASATAWSATSYTTVFGVAHLYSTPSGTAYWATTPSLNLDVDAGANIAVSFDLAYTSGSSSANASAYVGSAKFHVYISRDGGNTWTLERTITGSDLSNNGRTFHVLLNNYIGESIRLAFVAEGKSSSGCMHLGNLNVHTVDPSCLGISDLKPVTTANSINLSWTVTGTNTNAIAVISTHSDFSDTLNIQNVSAASASFSGLEAATAYYVSVRQDCEAGNTLTATVKTPCEASTITKEQPWTEGFENYTGTTYNENGIVPDCWSASTDGTIAPHVIGSGSWYWKHTGTKALTFYGSGNCYAVLPGFTNALNALQISFWMQMESASYGTLSLGYITAGDVNMNTFTVIEDYAANSGSMAFYETDLSSVPAEAAYLVFRWYWSSQYSCCIDDITISLLPECRKVQNVTVGAVSGTSAEVSFTENGAADYEVLVVTKAMNPDTLNTKSLEAYRDTVTASPAAVSDLLPATKHYVYVRALCSEENGAWSAAASFTTECEVLTITKTTPWVENFESYAVGSSSSKTFSAPCWINEHTVVVNNYTDYKYYVSSSNTTSTSARNLCLPDMSSGNITLLGLPQVHIEEADAYAFQIAVYRNSNSSSYAEEGIRVFASLSDTIDASAVELGFISRNYTQTDGNVVVAESASGWYTYEFLIPVAGNAVRILLQGESKYGASTYIDNFQIRKLPTCLPVTGINTTEVTANSASLSFTGVNNAQQYQLLVATASIDPATFNPSPDTIVYNETVYATSADLSNLESDTRYYVYVRSDCGDEDYSTWSEEFSFKTNCAAVAPAAFGVETFDDPASVDCWTFGFTHKGTSSYYAYAKRDSIKAYGAYIKLSKEAVASTKDAAGNDTVYSDGAYAISPMLDVTDIRDYQVSFHAATTNNTASNNYKRLDIGIITNPANLGSIVTLKTIELDYAADSAGIKSYTVSFAGYRGDMEGEFGQYVFFRLKEPSKRDSTNYVLIDNVSFEPASNCQQVLEAKADSIGVEGAKISWENSGASEYEVMLASINSLRPDTISNPIDTKQVSTTAAVLDALNSNTVYYAYVRGICGEGDTAKWSNSLRFRTSIGIPYDEPFSTTSLSEGWQSLYGNFSGDSILTSALSTPTGNYTWSIVAAGLPTGMTAPAAYGYIYDYATGDPWLISPAIDLAGHEGDFIEMTVDLAHSNTAETDASFYILISEDGGLTWTKANATSWLVSGGDYDINELPTTPTNFTISLTEYAGKKIAVAFYLHATNGSKQNYHGIYVDNIAVHTFEAVCRGVQQLAFEPKAQSAKVTWLIEGEPTKTALEIYPDADFAAETRIDSVGVEDIFEHTFSGLTSNTTYYVRAKQQDCADAVWVTKSFTTECDAISDFPWSDGFEDYSGYVGSSTTYASNYGNYPLEASCWKNEHLSGSGTYRFAIFAPTTTVQGNATHQLVLPDMTSGTQTLLTLPAFSLDEADAYQFELAVYRNASTSNYGEGLHVYASSKSQYDTTAVKLGFISRSYATADSSGVNIIPKESTTDWYTYKLSIPLQGDVHIFVVGESKYGSSTYADNFALTHKPACPDMRGFGVDSIVADSARLYVDNLDAHGYEFVVAKAEIDFAAMTAVDSAQIIFNDSVIGGTTLFVTGLTSATSYYAYARSLCDEGKKGAWSAVKSFVSACVVLQVADGSPYIENFNTLTSGIPACWDNSRGTVSDSYKWNYYATGYDGACVRFNSYTPSSGTTDTLVSPEIHLVEDAILSFYWKNSAGGAAAVLISADGGATFTTLESNLTSKSTWTLYEKNLSAYTGQTVQIYFASTSNCGYGDAYHYLDNVKVATVPSCLSVEGVVVDSIATDSARIRFNKSGDATYDVVVASAQLDMYHLSAADSAKIAFSADSFADTVLFANSLQPAHTYYVYVRMLCDATSISEWTEAVAFTTECDAIVISVDAPWSENFEAYAGYVSGYTGSASNYGAYPFSAPCWKNEHISGGGSYVFGIFAPSSTVQGNATHQLVLPDMSSGTQTLLALPQMAIDAADAYIFQMDMYRTSATSYKQEGVRIYVSTKDVIDSDATVLGFIPRDYSTAGTNVPAETASGWYTYSFTIPMSGDVYVLLRGESQYGSSSYMDNFMVSKLPDCRKVQDLAVDSVTKTSALLAFATNGAAEYEILATTKAINPDTLANVAAALIAFRDTIAGDTLAFDTAAVTGLVASGQYFAYVRALCGAEERGAWSDALSFFAECGEVEVGATGWSEDFESYAGTAYDVDNNDLACWLMGGNTTHKPHVASSGTYGYYCHSGSKCLSFYGSSSSNSYAALPLFVEALNGLQLEFWAKMESASSGAMSLGYITAADNGDFSTFHEVATYTSSTTMTKYETDLSALPAEAYRLVFRWYYSGSSYYTASIDDIKLTVLPACRPVKGLKAIDLTARAANVVFVKTPAEEYDFVITTESVNPDTIALVADSVILRHDTVTVDTIALDGLTPATNYYVYIHSLCAEGETTWTSAQFSTMCLVGIPFTEDFDDQLNRKTAYPGASSTYTIPTCWNSGYSSTSYAPYISDNTQYSTYAYSGTSALHLYTYYYSTKNTSYVVLPELDASLDTLQLSFKARAMYQGSSVSNYATSSYAHSIKIGTMTDPNDLSTFQLIDTHVLAEVSSTPSSADGYWEDVVVYLQGATGKYIALVADFEKTNYVWIDDVEVSKAPDCLAPSAVNVSAGARTADVTWMSIATEFEVALGAAGFVLPTGADTIFAVADTTGLHIADLEPSTDYELYVRAVCGDNVQSEWSKVAAFSTSCLLPDFAEYNFDDASTRYVHHRDSSYTYDYEYYEEESESYPRYMENCWTVGGSMNEYSYSSYSYEQYTLTGYYPRIYENESNTTYAHSGTGAIGFDYSSSYSTKPLVAAMAAMETLDRDSLQLEFWARPGYESKSTYSGTVSLSGASSSYARMLRVGLMTNPNDLTTFVPLRTIKGEVISGDPSADPEGQNYWRRYRINLAGTTAPYIAFVYDSTATNYFFVDDVRIKKIATCPEPADLTITDITDSSAIVRWDTIAPAYQVALIRGVDTTKTMVVDADSLVLENLEANTTYIVKLRAFCSENDSSEWSVPVSFTTECGSIATLPWMEDFEAMPTGNSSSAAPQCWDLLNANDGAYPYIYVNTSSTYVQSGSKSLYFQSSNTRYGYAILPEFDAPMNALKVTFSYKDESSTASGYVALGYMTDITDTSSFVVLASYPLTTSFQTVSATTVAIPEALASSVRLAFRYGGGTTSNYYMGIDDVSVEALDLNCLGVEDLKVSQISSNGVQLSFRFADGLEHDANVAISKEAAFDPTTAIMVDTISDSTYYFNVALETNTLYYLYARQYCGEDNGSAWQQVSFSTDCEAITSLPWSEDFESYAGTAYDVDNNDLACWLMGGNTTHKPHVASSGTYGYYCHSGSKCLSFYGSSSSNSYAALPLFVEALNGLQLEFWAKMESASSGAMSLGYITAADNGDFSTFHEVATYTSSTTMTKYETDLSALPAEAYRLVFRWYYSGSSYYTASIDDIRINSNVVMHYDAMICDGNEYEGANDGNSLHITEDEYHVGLNEYAQYAYAPEGSGQPDTLYTLSLTVVAIETFTDSVVLCEGEHFSQKLHGVDFTFDAYVGMPDQRRYAPTASGCENIVNLHIIAVNPKVEEHIYDSVALGEQYEWHGEIYVSATDARFDTLSAVTGCDSTVYLHLSVYQKEEALHGVHAQDLLIAPNPVHVGEPIHVLNDFLAEDLKEARIEIYSNTGALYYVQHGADQPFVLPAIEVSGMYHVRILIGDEIYLSTLLVQ